MCHHGYREVIPLQSLVRTIATRVTDVRRLRAARAADARVRAELASYRSDRDRAELDAILSRYDEADIAYLEALLAR